MTQTLEQLSAAATEGEAMSYAKSIVEAVDQGCNYEDRCLAVRDWLLRYRTGQLVAVTDDAIERVARAICEASGEAWRSGEGLRYPFSQNARQLNNHWLYKAKAAIAAMKGTQP